MIDAQDKIVGVIFPEALIAGERSDGASNKILWIVKDRNDSHLAVEAVATESSKEAPLVTFPPNSGPGEMYPSSVDVPEPGCWELTLSWASETAVVELIYE